MLLHSQHVALHNFLNASLKILGKWQPIIHTSLNILISTKVKQDGHCPPALSATYSIPLHKTLCSPHNKIRWPAIDGQCSAKIVWIITAGRKTTSDLWWLSTVKWKWGLQKVPKYYSHIFKAYLSILVWPFMDNLWPPIERNGTKLTMKGNSQEKMTISENA